MIYLARWILRRAGLVAWIGGILGLIGLFYSVKLYSNLRTDIEELLPTTARSITDLNEVTHRLEAFDSLIILTFSKDKEASKRFVIDLAAKLERVPKDALAGIEYRLDREIDFFSRRKALFVEVSDLERVRDFIEGRVSYEKELYNPLNIFSETELPEPVLDYVGLQAKYSSKASGFAHLPGGFYATADEQVRMIVAFMPGKGLEQGMKMKKAIVAAVEATNPKKYAPDLEVKYTGNIQNLLEESAALVADLELSTIIVVILVALVMVIFYRAFWATFILNGSLFIGAFWTFGVAYYAVGYLNANTAFLASIVLGNGINFGIIFLARYLEERRRGVGHPKAVEHAMVSTATSTGTAALAAGLSYGSLMLTGFRGFNQFGLIGLIGMILCWTSSYVLLPAYLTLMDRWFQDRWLPLRAVKPWFSGLVASAVSRFPGTITAIAALAVVASIAVLPKARFGVIENDLSKLRDKECMEKGAGALWHYINDIFKQSVTPTAILPRDRADVLRIAEALKNEREKEGKNPTLGSIQTLDDFTPKDQREKIRILNQIRYELPGKLMSRLTAGDQKLARDMLSPEAFTPFTEKDLPPLILRKFREKDGSIGKIVLVDKIYDGKVDDRGRLSRWVETVRRVTDSIAPGTPIAGQLPVSYDLFKAIEVDGPRATGFAFAAVILLVFLLFRDFRASLQTLVALILGVTWLAGIILGFDLKINFLNFIALPITFGIGVDYGVNIFQRYREVGPGKIVDVVRHTGGAVMLASLTTMIGYSSLLIAGNQAFVSFGTIAVCGELTCVVGAVVVVPALLKFLANLKEARDGKRALSS